VLHSVKGMQTRGGLALWHKVEQIASEVEGVSSLRFLGGSSSNIIFDSRTGRRAGGGRPQLRCGRWLKDCEGVEFSGVDDASWTAMAWVATARQGRQQIAAGGEDVDGSVPRCDAARHVDGSVRDDIFSSATGWTWQATGLPLGVSRSMTASAAQRRGAGSRLGSAVRRSILDFGPPFT
jgi:hypothetical protein